MQVYWVFTNDVIGILLACKVNLRFLDLSAEFVNRPPDLLFFQLLWWIYAMAISDPCMPFMACCLTYCVSLLVGCRISFFKKMCCPPFLLIAYTFNVCFRIINIDVAICIWMLQLAKTQQSNAYTAVCLVNHLSVILIILSVLSKILHHLFDYLLVWICKVNYQKYSSSVMKSAISRNVLEWKGVENVNTLEVKVLLRSLEVVTRSTQWAVGGIVAQCGSYISICFLFTSHRVLFVIFDHLTLQYLQCYAPWSETTQFSTYSSRMPIVFSRSCS